jgi:hypothetical protein
MMLAGEQRIASGEQRLERRTAALIIYKNKKEFSDENRFA